MTLESLAPDQLTARLYDLRRQERHLLVEFLACLAELERRGTFLDLGFPSSFVFCTSYLGLTKASAFRRTKAAALLTRFPQIADYLRDGRLGLTTLVELRDVLDDRNVGELLDRAAGKTEDEVKLLVATLQPQPAPRDLFRLVPSSGPVPTVDRSTAPPPRPPARIEPISEELRVLRVTVGREFAAELERVKAALSHRVPDGNLEAVLRVCLQTTLAVLEKRQRGAGRPATRPARTDRRYIATAVRRQVWERDASQCAFVSTDGRRCTATHRLQLHHLVPFAKGGLSTVENLALRCQPHNLHAARQDYGSARIDRFAGAAP